MRRRRDAAGRSRGGAGDAPSPSLPC
jgi:hypothetical protein